MLYYKDLNLKLKKIEVIPGVVWVTNLVLADFPVVLRQIHLVGDDHEGVLGRVFDVSIGDKLPDPRVQVVERLTLVESESEEAHVRASVEGRPQAFETLLTRSVPDLEKGQENFIFRIFN